MKQLLTLLALVLCSCAETFVGEETTRPNNENLPDLTAAFAKEDNTRTYIEDGKYLRWHEDDRLTIFFGNTLNRQYKFNGATGDNSGTFSLVPDGMLGTGNAFDHIYALYPYNADARITDEGVISLTLPAVQNYAENSFGRGANTMLAVTENLEDTFLAFKNACGYLKVKLYNAEGATIKSIEVKGNSGERLAGAATATIVFGEAPIVTMAESATDTITLNCGEGVALGTTAETATEFWVTLPATTFAEGLTITATDTEGGVFEKSTTNEVIIERNAIQPMAVLEAKFVATKPANNEIWYTNGSTIVATTPYETTAFGANIVSNTYDAAKECWVIKFDGEVTTIGDNAFVERCSLTSVTIPDSVTTIGHGAFSNCNNLTSITIPDSVTTIRDYAFGYCSSLTSVTIGDSVTSIGYWTFGYCSSLTSVTIPDSVMEIGDDAFYKCSSLTSVTIGDSVTTIDGSAFSYCSSLTEFNGKYASEDGRCLIIDGTLESFAPAGLTEYTIPDSVTTIAGAFMGCSSLTSVTIPDSVTTIKAFAFEYCSSLKKVYCKATTPPAGDYRMFYNNASGRKIYVPMESVEAYKSASYWRDYADDIVGYDFENGVAVTPKPANNEIWYTNGSTTQATTPYRTNVFGANIVSNTYDAEKECWVITFDGDVTKIGDEAFYYCPSLTSVTIPDSVTSIGNSAFYYCSSLTSVTIGDSVTEIGEGAFYYCRSLTSVTIPDSVTTIGGGAFHSCSSLQEFNGTFASEDGRCLIIDGVLNSFAIGCGATEYTIPDSVTTIGDVAFEYCSSLTSVTIPNSVTTIGYAAFYNCDSLTSVTIGNGVTTIGDRAFWGCKALTSITIPDSVTTIGDYAFRYCSSLTSITIPDSVTAIGYEAFAYCYSLTSVTIPDSVTKIGSSAFSWCESLTSVYCKPTTPPAGGPGMFYYNASGRKIYVPVESVEAYKSAKWWSEDASDIVGYNF